MRNVVRHTSVMQCNISIHHSVTVAILHSSSLRENDFFFFENVRYVYDDDQQRPEFPSSKMKIHFGAVWDKPDWVWINHYEQSAFAKTLFLFTPVPSSNALRLKFKAFKNSKNTLKIPKYDIQRS